ncbi:MAG: IS6 family transposase [Pseudonocardiales bacterium]|nr:MAG: IS6 family transposase [Pseudonocardiales bacterium]
MDATPSSLCKGYRYPVEIISHCVWLYHRFPLSLREVEEMMMARGVLVTYETIHQWCRKFGQTYQDGNVLDILVTSRRDAKAATRFFRKLLRRWRFVPRVLVTDKLASYGVAHRELMRDVEHRRSKYLNNRAENSHQPTRQRERAMKKFTSPGGAQRFLSAFSGISPHFRPRRHRLTAAQYRHEMTTRFTTWNEIVGLPTAA